jgi:hypothetical protein
VLHVAVANLEQEAACMRFIQVEKNVSRHKSR